MSVAGVIVQEVFGNFNGSEPLWAGNKVLYERNNGYEVVYGHLVQGGLIDIDRLGFGVGGVGIVQIAFLDTTAMGSGLKVMLMDPNSDFIDDFGGMEPVYIYNVFDSSVVSDITDMNNFVYKFNEPIVVPQGWKIMLYSNNPSMPVDGSARQRAVLWLSGGGTQVGYYMRELLG